MPGIRDKVAIIGMGCTKFGERWDAGWQDLLVEAAQEAYKDAGVEAKDIQAAWLGSHTTLWTGQPLAEALKFDYIPITRIENACATGTDAFRNACYAVAAGVYDVVMVAGCEMRVSTPPRLSPSEQRRTARRRRSAASRLARSKEMSAP